MLETAVADTGPFAHLCEIGQESLLQVFDSIRISPHVADEIRRLGLSNRVTSALGDRLILEEVSDGELNARKEALQPFRLHAADLSVAALAIRFRPTTVLTDDLQLRKALEDQRHRVVGSVGILVRARQTGRVSKEYFHRHLELLLNGSSLYLSKAFRSYVLKLMRDA